MLDLDILIQSRLREEFLAQIETILTVAEADRRDAAAANFEELNEDIERFDSVLKDAACWKLLTAVSFLSKPPVDDHGNLAAAQKRLQWVRRDGDPESKIARMFRIKKRPG